MQRLPCLQERRGILALRQAWPYSPALGRRIGFCKDGVAETHANSSWSMWQFFVSEYLNIPETLDQAMWNAARCSHSCSSEESALQQGMDSSAFLGLRSVSQKCRLGFLCFICCNPRKVVQPSAARHCSMPKQMSDNAHLRSSAPFEDAAGSGV